MKVRAASLDRSNALPSPNNWRSSFRGSLDRSRTGVFLKFSRSERSIPSDLWRIWEETLNHIIMKRNLVPTVLSALVATSLLIGVSAKGQGLSAEEQQFVKKAAAGGLAEVKLSELAKERPPMRK